MKNISKKLDLVIELFNGGNKEKALTEINLLLKSNKEDLDLLFTHAKISMGLNDLNQANQSLINILNIQPNNIRSLKLIYINFLKMNNYIHAKNYIDKLLVFENNNYEVLRDKAFIEYLNKDYNKSEIFIKKAIKINQEEVFGLNIIGLLKIEKRETLKAIKFFEKAISINPKYTDSYNNLGKCYIDLEKLNQAYICFKKAYRVNSGSDLAIMNIANILSLKDKNKLAIKFYEKAKKINPRNNEADENIFICNCRLKNMEWVKNKFQSLQNSEIVNYNINLGYSYLLLNKKRFVEGFNLFDARLKTKSFPITNINHSNILIKLNNQKELNKNSKILIIKEQGVGDEILFSSLYNDLIKDNYSNIMIECDPRLLEIFKRSFKKNIFFPFGHFSSQKSVNAKFDNILYSGSLTKYYRKNEKDFNNKPYLKTQSSLDNKISLKLKKYINKKKVGISWKSVINIYGSLKSLRIQDFDKLFSKERVFFNLQYGDSSKEINQFIKNDYKIYNFDNIDLFNDFDSLMSILKNVDVFVTVSNSTAHFAGALGVPTILICPKRSSTYYYWDYENGRTPWYKSVSVVKFKDSIENTMNLVNELINKI